MDWTNVESELPKLPKLKDDMDEVRVSEIFVMLLNPKTNKYTYHIGEFGNRGENSYPLDMKKSFWPPSKYFELYTSGSGDYIFNEKDNYCSKSGHKIICWMIPDVVGL